MKMILPTSERHLKKKFAADLYGLGQKIAWFSMQLADAQSQNKKQRQQILALQFTINNQKLLIKILIFVLGLLLYFLI
jgi:hypothetical protein